MRFLLLLLYALMFSPILHAADWVSLPPIPNGDFYFYDKSKLVIKDDEIIYWKKVQFKTPQSHNGKDIASGILRERINCAEHSSKLLTYLYYSPNGDTADYVAQDESAPSPIVPDTIGDKFDNLLCPIVWRKQEETRIKNEQRTAEIEAKLTKETASKTKEDSKATTTPAATVPPPAKPANPVRPGSKNPIQKPIPPRVNSITPTKTKDTALANENEAKPTDTAKPSSSVILPEKSPMHLPEPQILEQLY